jgi:hypothetical protein
MATATQPATIKAVEQPEDDRQMLRLDAEAAQIVVDSLLIEWENPGKGSCAGGERGLRSRSARDACELQSPTGDEFDPEIDPAAGMYGSDGGDV